MEIVRWELREDVLERKNENSPVEKREVRGMGEVYIFQKADASHGCTRLLKLGFLLVQETPENSERLHKRVVILLSFVGISRRGLEGNKYFCHVLITKKLMEL